VIGLFVVFREFLRAIRYAVRAPEAQALMATTALVLLGGTLFYMLVEGWSAVDALYFSVVTLATIGYGDLTPTTDLSKLFTVLYVLIGIGLVASTVATLATAAVKADADRRAQARERRGQTTGSGGPPDEPAPIAPLVGRFAARHTRPAETDSGTSENGGTKEVDQT
jgi:hypothetical protein